MITLTGGNFQDAAGNPIANGNLTLALIQDAQIPSINGQIAAGIPINVSLDGTGNVLGTVQIWSNAELLPSGTAYEARLFNANGAEVWDFPQFWILPNISPLDLGTLVPQAGGISYPNPITFALAIIAYSATPAFITTASMTTFSITLAGNASSSTLTSAQSPGTFISFFIAQDNIGFHSFVWPTNVFGGEDVSGAGPNIVMTQTFQWDGTNARAIGPGVFA